MQRMGGGRLWKTPIVFPGAYKDIEVTLVKGRYRLWCSIGNHRQLGMQAVLTVVLLVTFVVFAIKLAAGHQVVTPATVQGADLVGAFILEVTIALSLSISWASYAADFSRYLPADSSRARVFGFTFGGIVLAYIFVQGIGIAAGDLVSEQTADGVRSVMGGGILGALALLVIALASIGSGVMNDYSGSLALQTLGVRRRRCSHREGEMFGQFGEDSRCRIEPGVEDVRVDHGVHALERVECVADRGKERSSVITGWARSIGDPVEVPDDLPFESLDE
jgi:hypothetical protein